MRERMEQGLRELGRRAGLRDLPVTVVAAAVVLAALFVVWAAWRWWPRGEATISAGAGEVAVIGGVADARTEGSKGAAGGPPASEEGTTVVATESVFVHVAGMVRRPGVYELPAGSRVVDALDAAGGIVGDAAPDALNLARIVADGEQVLVPSEKEALKQPLSAGTQGGAVAGGQGGTNAQAPIDINTADPGQLDTLPGVGPSTAAKIVAEREANGPFTSVDDLARVSGIGPKRLEQLRNLVCVR